MAIFNSYVKLPEGNSKAAIFHWKIDRFRWSFSLKPIHWSARLNISMSQNARFCQWSRRSPGVPSPSSPWQASCLQVWYSHPWATVDSRLRHDCSMTGSSLWQVFPPPTIRIHTDPYGISMYLSILFPLLPKRFLKARDQQRKKPCVNDAGIPGIPCHPCTRHPSMYHPCTIHVPSMYHPCTIHVSFKESYPAQFHRHFRLRPSCRLVTELCNSALCICQILSINSLPGQDRGVSVSAIGTIGQESNDSIGNKLSVRVSVKLRCH